MTPGVTRAGQQAANRTPGRTPQDQPARMTSSRAGRYAASAEVNFLMARRDGDSLNFLRRRRCATNACQARHSVVGDSRCAPTDGGHHA
jgi:hypothetical protein